MAHYILKSCLVCGSDLRVGLGDAEVSCHVCGSSYEVVPHGMPEPEVTHRASEGSFTFTAQVAYHDTTCSAVAPSTVTVGTSFKVEIVVTCVTAIVVCDLRGKTIQVIDHTGAVAGSGTLTERFAVPGGYSHRGYVTVTAPSLAGSYTWKGRFPQQSPGQQHRVCDAVFTFEVVPKVPFPAEAKALAGSLGFVGAVLGIAWISEKRKKG